MSIQIWTQKKASLIRPNDNSDVVYRLNRFSDWLEIHGQTVLTADLAHWRDDLLKSGYAKSSVNAMLSTTRERLRELTRSNEFISELKMSLWESNRELSPADLELQVQGILRQMENNADARNSRVKDTIIQDELDDARLWLNGQPMIDLLTLAPEGKPELLGLRDQAIVALFLATGIRREELCNLLVTDLNKTFQGEMALLVRSGKGNKQRAIPYGELWGRFVEPYVLPWIEFVGFGYAFQGFWKGFEKTRHKPLNPATINAMLEEIPLTINNEPVHVTPHSLRRTYARMLFQEYGVKIEGIQQNMGHADLRTTQDYIGVLDVEFRVPLGRKE